MICPGCGQEVGVYRSIDLDELVIRKRRCTCGRRWRTVEHDEGLSWAAKRRSLVGKNDHRGGSLVTGGGSLAVTNGISSSSTVISATNDPKGGRGGSVSGSDSVSVSAVSSGVEASGSVTSQGVDRPRAIRRRRPHEYQQDFLTFWEAYPKKVGKGGAFISWERQSPDLPVVLGALAWQCQLADWLKEGGAYVPNPATYLNQRRWEDEPPAMPNGASHARPGARGAALNVDHGLEWLAKRGGEG